MGYSACCTPNWAQVDHNEVLSSSLFGRGGAEWMIDRTRLLIMFVPQYVKMLLDVSPVALFSPRFVMHLTQSRN